MAKSNLINMLNRKYSELLGQLHYVKPRPDNVAADLEHLTATIKLFAPDWTGEGIKPLRPYSAVRWPKQGDGIKAAMKVLSEAKEPLTARQISFKVLAIYGYTEPSALEVKLCVSGFNSILRKRIGRSVMVIEGRPKRWLIKTDVR